MSRVIDCPCGHQLRGADDEELFRLARQHITEDHPDMQRSDEQVRQTIRDRARDAEVVTSSAGRGESS
jgi:predicted small metal-binding protein